MAEWSRTGDRVIGVTDEGSSTQRMQRVYSVAVNGSGAWHLTEG